MTSKTASAPTAARVRRQFIDHFVDRHGHTFVPSSPVVPHDDPTLLFTNAGMNQFKPIFLGQVEAGSALAGLRRAVNSQKCIRAGGKHNDLEDVGRDHYHHTFFEMLGNWSFGDYFKAEAIEWAWELLTAGESAGGWGLDTGRLHVTVFAGDESEGLKPDTEAEEIWKKYVAPERISRWSKKDNFWEMGATGPCGPCSEIHYDFTGDRSGRALVNAGDPRVIELWNLVFIEFNRDATGTLTPLPAKHVDTGMGLERLVRVLQHKDSNYDIDLFAPIFDAIATHTNAQHYRGSLEDPVDVAYRVIADHIRCLTTAITDGARPGNEGRSYVLRRILRRAVRHARQTLGVDGPLLSKLVPAVVDSLGDAFPELKDRAGKVAQIIRDEEESFLRTLDRGIALFGNALKQAGEGSGARISAEDAFKLHDTYGFPIDLTRIMAEERGVGLDEAGYEALMVQARQRSRQARGDQLELALESDAVGRLKERGIKPTSDDAKYAGGQIQAEVKAIIDDGKLENRVPVGRTVAVILDMTCHYVEAGGQVGDRGEIRTVGTGRPETRFLIQDTQASAGYVLHIGRVLEGELRVGDRVSIEVDQEHRRPVLANHTATHLLNFALREVIGPEEEQKGSLVAPERLRFDFSCSHAMSREQLAESARIVNHTIGGKLPVYSAYIPLAEARRICGVRAVFGEKYPDPVRVVAIGIGIDEVRADPTSARWRGHSIELCGGTHVGETSQAGRFEIIQEQALAAGIRRITALTGAAADAAAANGRRLQSRVKRAAELAEELLEAELKEITSQLKELAIPAIQRGRIDEALEPLRDRVKAAKKKSRAASRAGVVQRARRIAAAAAGRIIVEQLDDTDPQSLLTAMDVIRALHRDAAVMLIGADNDTSKVSIVARVPDDLIQRGLEAGHWVRRAAEICGGRGGGRSDMAQAGGNDPAAIPTAVAAAQSHAEPFLEHS